ncbi:hypothetical protein GTA08_BOTSDO13373 [Botryosphaeria dothidea]|uniref:Uncharacterized protein n=1 Tax=Botryosphaeria dothidea TaxID=55169 RepID=A0A8H4J211_9PEZI|nr:hypothetical protein GTA08_BOTSDO13373 [Botryosphaeria dothidea]
MRHTVRYHLRALVRPLKRRATGLKGSSSSKASIACGGPCHYHNQHHNRSAYSLLPADDMLLDESIELLPPPRMVPAAAAAFDRPSTAPSSPASSRPALMASTSTSTLDTSCGPSTPRSETPSDLPDIAAQRRRRRRETWAKSLALDTLFLLPDEDGVEQKKDDDVETKPRDTLRTKRDSFMWMKFDGHGSGLAWADGARLAGAPMVM